MALPASPRDFSAAVWGAWSVAITSIVPSVNARDRALRGRRALPQRRVHLEAALLLQILVAQQQVVRRRLAAHAHAPSPGRGAPVRRSPSWRRGRRDTGSRSSRPARCRVPTCRHSLSEQMPLCPCSRQYTAVVDIAARAAGRRPRSEPRSAYRQPAARRIASSISSAGLHAAAVVREADDLRARKAAKSTSSPAPALAHRDTYRRVSTRTTASRRMISGLRAERIAGASGAGFRLGIEQTVVYPPAGRGGRTRWRWSPFARIPARAGGRARRPAPVTRCRPPRSTTRSPGRGSPAAAMRPPSTAISPGLKRPLRKIFALV